MSDSDRYYGKYRGYVQNNKDPDQLGRVAVSVPGLINSTSPPWALPSLPLAGSNEVFFALPSIGSHVWVEFEAGDRNRPIWSGCFWEKSSELPPQLQATPRRILLRTGGLSIELDDSSKTIKVLGPNNQTIVLSEKGIEISSGGAGTILVSTSETNINNGGLEVLG